MKKMNSKFRTGLAAVTVALLVVGCASAPSVADLSALTQQIVKASFRDEGIVKASILNTDETNQACSEADASGKPLDEKTAKRIEEINMKAIKWPSDGKFIGDWKEGEFYAKDYFIWEEGTTPIGQTIGTADWADYCGQRVHLSQIIPIKTFNETAYSIIAETDFDNTLSCFTEKTAKPMIARRLFIAFTGYKFLHNLRALGFQTFDGIIDESYDLEIDDNKRYTMAFEQVKYLCTQEQDVVYRKIKSIVDHNYNLLMTRDWTQWPAKQIEQVINSVSV